MSRRTGQSGTGVNSPTVIAAAGLAAVISSLIVVVGVVAMMLSGAAPTTAAQSPATVVSLGDTQQAPAVQGGTQTPAATADASAPVAEDAPATDESGLAPGAPVVATRQQAPTTAQSQGSGPTPPTLAEFNSQLTTLSGNSSSAQKAKLLEGGSRAVGPISKVLYLVKQYSYTGFRYQVVGPLTQNGTTANARLQMTLPGSGSRYIPLRWVWKDSAWKLSDKSVCDISAYAQMPCSL